MVESNGVGGVEDQTDRMGAAGGNSVSPVSP